MAGITMRGDVRGSIPKGHIFDRFFGPVFQRLRARRDAAQGETTGGGNETTSGGGSSSQQTNVAGSFLTRNPSARTKPIKRKSMMGEY